MIDPYDLFGVLKIGKRKLFCIRMAMNQAGKRDPFLRPCRNDVIQQIDVGDILKRRFHKSFIKVEEINYSVPYANNTTGFNIILTDGIVDFC